ADPLLGDDAGPLASVVALSVEADGGDATVDHPQEQWVGLQADAGCSKLRGGELDRRRVDAGAGQHSVELAIAPLGLAGHRGGRRGRDAWADLRERLGDRRALRGRELP